MECCISCNSSCASRKPRAMEFFISACERLRPRLFFLKRLPFAHHRFILAARAGVGQKGANALADGNHFRLVNDGLAQFPGLGFNPCGHNLFIWHTINHKFRRKAIGLPAKRSFFCGGCNGAQSLKLFRRGERCEENLTGKSKSQRDSILQPRVGAKRLPWVVIQNSSTPTGFHHRFAAI